MSNDFHRARLARIADNQRKLAELGVPQAALDC
jgi:hypothetical protein